MSKTSQCLQHLPEILRLLSRGDSIRQVAQAIGVSILALDAFCRRRALPRTRRKAPNGTGWIAFGYQYHHIDDKPRRLHMYIAERALGHPLPTDAVVHHVDGNRLNNANANLVICPNESYHRLLHMRTRALEETGHADWRKCKYCCQWDSLENMSSYRQYTDGLAAYHKACAAKRARDKRAGSTPKQPSGW